MKLMEKNQTAVEWLLSRLKEPNIEIYMTGTIQKAKEMEKMQIMNAFIDGVQDASNQILWDTEPKDVEEYFAEIYGSTQDE